MCNVLNKLLFFVIIKYNRGRWKKPVWVLGILHRQGRRKLPIFKIIPNRSADVIIPIIRKYVLPGSEITTDCWRAYNRLQHLNYTHHKVNHKRYFVHPITGKFHGLGIGRRIVINGIAYILCWAIF